MEIAKPNLKQSYPILRVLRFPVGKGAYKGAESNFSFQSICLLSAPIGALFALLQRTGPAN